MHVFKPGAVLLLAAAMVWPACGQAQHDMSHMAGMDHQDAMEMDPAGTYLMSLASGTSMNPRSWPMPALMPRVGSWNLMLMGQAFLVDTQQSGPRGGDKLYAPNWAMISASHTLAGGSVMFQSMLSLDPATVTHRSYPLLFQTGETAYGKPLVDAQHPHDLFMGLGLHYAHPVGEDTMLHVYYAPVGDPALGPVAFPHRASAMELPQATLGHHWQDSTHIADNTLTVAMQHKWLRLEASGFYGTEPNENRWNIDWGPMNSYSGRISIFPVEKLDGAVFRREAGGPGAGAGAAGDVVRTTASVHYTRPLGNGSAWSSSAVWGRNRSVETDRSTGSFLLETMYPLTRKDFVTGRMEIVDKDELLQGTPGVFRIQAYTGGYTRDIGTYRNLESGLGAECNRLCDSGRPAAALRRPSLGAQHFSPVPLEAGRVAG
jgi:hypothetical protein